MFIFLVFVVAGFDEEELADLGGSKESLEGR